MAESKTLGMNAGFGKTSRKDGWWVGPLLTDIGLGLFVVYATYAGMQGGHFEIRQNSPAFAGAVVAPYLSPFYSPLLYDATSPHAWIQAAHPSWWPSWLPFSAAMLILAGPASFRATCYYYRKAYYRTVFMDPVACAVGEPRTKYKGENRGLFLLQNAHRFTMYIAVAFLVILWYDALKSFCWPTDSSGKLLAGGAHQFGMGLGTLVMLVNVLFLSFFTLGCNSVRHLLGGRMDCFSCGLSGGPGGNKEGSQKLGYHTWRLSTLFNERHMLWAWFSLCSVGFTDLYVRLCSMGVIHDVRFF